MTGQYRGGVEFEDEGRVRSVYTPKSGFLFRLFKKLHLAKTDSGASVWVATILIILIIVSVRIFINIPRTVKLKDGPGMTAEQLIEYNKIQPFDYEAEIKALQQ